MIIFPAIDLKEGKCVRLYQGEMSSSEIVGEDAVKTALSFKNSGAEYLHMVDLDGAVKGSLQNMDVVLQVVKEVKIPVELGGGIRDLQTIDTIIDKGISRVILGTEALSNPEMVKEAVKKYNKKIAIGIDAKNELVAVDGWLNVSKVKYIDFAKKIEDIGVQTIIYTDISRDGTLTGPNLEQLSRINSAVSCNIIASGGVKNIESIKELKEIGVYGAIVGKAIYSHNINLEEAISVGRE
ncbi:1-(5-phosphoribosyl)-5-[(5-phosphoribosylamino)methylideneamino]imidazole-4-carboxamide isomerase [Clostridium sp. A1-XYC3]|uniref:1-(5-phosphoribosyl)-5-[(5-phosphoribosylamino)methylideneamino] imidazole-4-carboxamide isomerase n=1 Tax=Clostridium tanneri TaxID=3037988 RepID=A0ABU4JSR9_9CLOT|nr:1-(5-phosphoribosyl)-5-[(5-phosphoribosylamino)methylideneamino]imidazole-4-carboxamide isomerase [Clostridium sp. A1-XYC3]MDW8801165.1 1-(5-phosphoribosyl)-5-[(5-phosphoribosylamino)methylideneamino]imidazole-4-carboxamide isomerase [Clostridium sp. A1-XYC3]